MILNHTSKARNVNGIDTDELVAICNFLQGAVYCWCKNRPDEWFALRDLMGGDNFYWEGTALLPLYEKHKAQGDAAVAAAGKDSGWLLKKTIEEDKRNFETKKAQMVRMYKWDGDTSY